MNLALELKKREVERAKVSAGIADFELKILEVEENVKRLQEQISISSKRVSELDAEIAELKKQGKG